MIHETLIIGGNWDNHVGKPSKIISALGEGLGVPLIDTLNGGKFQYLQKIMEQSLPMFKTVIWMPNVSNDEDKLLSLVKKINPHILLISSKRIDGRDLSDFDLVGRALKSHSNLLIKINKEKRFSFELMDPLGNTFGKTEDVNVLAASIKSRVGDLLKMSRKGSERAGDRGDVKIPKEFIELVRDFGGAFTTYVNAVNPKRFLGNASTRCMSGFPSMKIGPEIFVSRRNVDKKGMSSKDFVEVKESEGKNKYWGEDKPSVDTPVQLMLYKKYPRIKYMIHGHVYIDGAKMTKSKVPCGYLDEFDEIVELIEGDVTSFCVNLRGHGFVCGAENLDYIWSIFNFMKSRPMLED